MIDTFLLVWTEIKKSNNWQKNKINKYPILIFFQFPVSLKSLSANNARENLPWTYLPFEAPCSTYFSCCAISFNHKLHFLLLCYAISCSDGKGAEFGESSPDYASTVQEHEDGHPTFLTCQKFIRASIAWSGASDRSSPPPPVRQTTQDKVYIQLYRSCGALIYYSDALVLWIFHRFSELAVHQTQDRSAVHHSTQRAAVKEQIWNRNPTKQNNFKFLLRQWKVHLTESVCSINTSRW